MKWRKEKVAEAREEAEEVDRAHPSSFYWRRTRPTVDVCFYCRRPIDGMVQILFSGRYHCGCEPEAVVESQRQERESRVQHGAKWPPFELHRPCSKCGNEHRKAELHEPYGQGIARECGPEILFCAGGRWPYIKRKCGVCGFVTHELPLDWRP